MKSYYYCLFSFLFCFSLLQATEEPFDISNVDINLSAECEPLTTVANCVNVQSGQFFQIEQDFKSNTIDPLQLIRFYDSGSSIESFLGSGFGSQYPFFASSIQDNGRSGSAMISERDGFMLPYCCTKKNYEIDSRLYKKGYTNYKTSRANNNIAIRKANFSVPEFWSLDLGNGVQRIYGKAIKADANTISALELPTKKGFLLTEEKKANGNTVRYEYEAKEGKPLVSKITTLNRKGEILNAIEFEHNAQGCRLKSSCGTVVDYIQDCRSCFKKSVQEQKVLTRVAHDPNDWIVYQTGENTLDKKKFSRISMVNKPEGYYQKVNYDAKNRVESLVEPTGVQGNGVVTHKFEYIKNATQVVDPFGQKTIYNFDENKRITSIDTYDQNKLMKQEVFEWDTHSEQRGWLKSKSLRLNNQIYHTTSYEYDSSGNVIREILTAVLSGDGLQYYLGNSSRNTQKYITEYEYTQDGRNLLINKKTPEGLNTHFEYENNSNLITKKLVSYQGNIQERLFCTYDHNGQPEKIVEDDGSGPSIDDLANVTYRKSQLITSVKQPGSSFGKPESIEYRYGGDQKLLKRVDFSYDNSGNEIGRKHFDSSLNFCFETQKEYDYKNRVIAYTDALGQVIHYNYDGQNNITDEIEVGSGKSTHYAYDCMYRLARKTEVHSNGEQFVIEYKYNELNQLISKTDPYNNETTYAYDRLGRITSIGKPPSYTEKGELVHASMQKKYDISGLIEEIDEKGANTVYRNNIYGKPVHILYPDRHQEWNCYYPSGLIQQRTYADKSYRQWEYDSKDRIIKESFFDKNNQLLSEESYTYKGKLLASFTDSLGLKTTYKYDSAGRKISEKTGQNKATLYKYDSFDRISEIKKEFGAHTKYEILTYDGLDRLTSKTLKDDQDNLKAYETYTYDRQGNQTLLIKYMDHCKTSTYETKYHSDGTVKLKRDALQKEEKWIHDHHFTNQNGQCVHVKKIVDALGRYILEENDSNHRLSKRSVFNGENPFSVTNYYYDAAGNEVKQVTQVMAEDTSLREYGVIKTYNAQGLVSSQTEIPSNTTTHFEYNFRGNLTKKIKSDGVAIIYTYDPLGRILSMNSSDQTISYEFKYDRHTMPIEIIDNVTHTLQKREYDQFDRLIKEEYESNLVLHYSYDLFDRLTKLKLPDNSSIVYEYNPFYLKKIERLNESGKVNYEVECLSYDKCGNLLQLKNPSGKMQFSYDLLNRAQSITTPVWKSNLTFDAVGNLKRLNQSDLEGILKKEMQYDCLNHLVQEPDQEYIYDSLGNCIRKNGNSQTINSLNQLIKDEVSEYRYDMNGNLISQSVPDTTYQYDALNRLKEKTSENRKSTFQYDSFGRLLATGSQKFLYQGIQEIGCFENGKLTQLRLMHPDVTQDRTFALELEGKVYYPIQDFRGNICGLNDSSGVLLKTYRYSAFGDETSSGSENIESPWRFANRRQIDGLTLFTHRYYNPKTMRWLTTDPAGFAQGLNLYTYNRNNPYYYTDPDGRFVWMIPIFCAAFEAGAFAVIIPTLECVIGAIIGGSVGVIIYHDIKVSHDTRILAEITEEEEAQRKEEPRKTNGTELKKKPKRTPLSKGGPPRSEHASHDYLPDLAAEGSDHTTLGIKSGRSGDYVQGATFEDGKFTWRTDVTNHKRGDHCNPHRHPAISPCGVEDGTMYPITWL